MKFITTIWIMLFIVISNAQRYDYPKAAVKPKIVTKEAHWEQIESPKINQRVSWEYIESDVTELTTVKSEFLSMAKFSSGKMRLENRSYVPELSYKDGSRLDIRYLDQAHGFFSNDLNEIIEMEDGRMMFFSPSSIAIYDGQYMSHYSTPDGVDFFDVYAAELAPDGRIWIATRNGLYYWKDDAVYSLSDYGANGCWSVKALRDGQILVGEFGSGILSIRSDSVYRISGESLIDDVRNFCEDGEGDLWMASQTGLVKRSGNRWYSYDYFKTTKAVTAVTDYRGSIYIGTKGDGLFKLKAKKLQHLIEEATYYPIYNFAKTKGGLWFSAYLNGLILIDEEDRFIHFSDKEGLSDLNSHRINSDRFGNLWIAHFGGGVSVFREQNFRPSRYHNDSVFVVELKGSHDAAYLFCDRSSPQRKVGGKHYKLKCDIEGIDNDIWMGDVTGPDEFWAINYGTGLTHYKDGKITRYLDTTEDHSKINLEPRMDKYGRVWHVDYFYNLRYLQNDSIYRFADHPELGEHLVNFIHNGEDRQLLVFLDDGVLLPMSDHILFLDKSSGLSANHVFECCSNRFGTGNWLFTDKGMDLLVGTEVIESWSFDFPNNVPLVSTIQVSEHEFLFSASNGIHRLTLEADGPKFKYMGREYGQFLANDNYLAVIQDTVRLIYNGFVHDYLKDWNGNSKALPQVNLMKGMVNDEVVKFPIEMDQNDQLKILFSVINFGKEQTIVYRLKGQSKWVSISEPEIYLTGLSHGDYILEVKVTNENGASQVLAVPILVTPWWYQTTWFIVSIICVIVIILVAFFLYRISIQRKRAEKLEISVNEKTKELKLKKEQLEKELSHNAMLLKEVHHRVKNNMQMVSGILELQLSKTENKDYRNTLKIATDRIKAVSISHQNLYRKDNFESLFIKEYFEAIANNLGRAQDLSIDLDIPEDFQLPLERAQMLGLIFNEQLTNTLKHAWPSSFSGNREVHVNISRYSHETVFIFKDNGIGISQEQIASPNMGLLLLNGFAERQMKGSIHYRTNKGTEITIKFPVQDV